MVTAVGVLGDALWMSAPTATADSGGWYNAYGTIYFDDGANHTKVCDTRTDSVGVSGRISVRQGSGAWYHHKWHRDGTGNDSTCAGGYETINLEGAKVLLTICAQNGAGTVRYACSSTEIYG